MFPIFTVSSSATPMVTLAHLLIATLVFVATLLMCEPAAAVHYVRRMREADSVREVVTAVATRHASGPTETHGSVGELEGVPLSPFRATEPTCRLSPTLLYTSNVRTFLRNEALPYEVPDHALEI